MIPCPRLYFNNVDDILRILQDTKTFKQPLRQIMVKGHNPGSSTTDCKTHSTEFELACESNKDSSVGQQGPRHSIPQSQKRAKVQSLGILTDSEGIQPRNVGSQRSEKYVKSNQGRKGYWIKAKSCISFFFLFKKKI